MHEDNCFITLTYDNEHLPRDGSLHVEHWQKFAKRLRKARGPFRFFHCGEYGAKSLRPHYHAAIFGLGFEDQVKWKKNSRGEWLYVSKLLGNSWKFGFSSVGALTYESAAYVARYVMSKATVPESEDPAVLARQKRHFTRYERIDRETGEVHTVKPEYVTMSRRPGIGTSWYEKFKSDVYPSDEVVVEGRRFRPPRFYDEKLDEAILGELKDKRFKAALLRKEDSTPERLKVREKALDIELNSRLKRRI